MAMPELEPPKVEPVEKRKFNFKQEYDTNPTFNAGVDESRARRKERQNTQQLVTTLAMTERANNGKGKLY